jgi:uncharacterized protein (TIGR03000 family)
MNKLIKICVLMMMVGLFCNGFVEAAGNNGKNKNAPNGKGNQVKPPIPQQKPVVPFVAPQQRPQPFAQQQKPVVPFVAPQQRPQPFVANTQQKTKPPVPCPIPNRCNKNGGFGNGGFNTACAGRNGGINNKNGNGNKNGNANGNVNGNANANKNGNNNKNTNTNKTNVNVKVGGGFGGGFGGGNGNGGGYNDGWYGNGNGGGFGNGGFGGGNSYSYSPTGGTYTGGSPTYAPSFNFGGGGGFGGYDGYGLGVAAAPVAVPQPLAVFDEDDPDTAWLTVELPDEKAEVWLNDLKMPHKGLIRKYISPPLDPKLVYNYDIKVQWTEGGVKQNYNAKVSFKAGDEINHVVPRLGVKAAVPMPKLEPTEEDNERAANGKLNMAKDLIKEKKLASVKNRLEDIIKKYPDTKAAETAKDLLSKLQE